MKPYFRFLALPLLAVSLSHSHAEPPQIVTHQGRIAVDGANFGAPTAATGYFKFALVAGGATETFWTNDGTNQGTPGGQPAAAVPVTVTNGLYTVGLGDTSLGNMTALPADVFAQNDDVRLRIWFGDDNSAFELLAPDQRLVSTGYALNAGSLTIADGAAAGNVLVSDAQGNASWGPSGGGSDTLTGLTMTTEIGQVAVFNGADWVAQDFPDFVWEPATQAPDTFTVDFSEGPNFAQGAWTEVLEGGLILNPPNSSCWEDLQFTGPINPSGALTTADFAVNGLYGADTIQVQGIEIDFPRTPATGGATTRYKRFQAGAGQYGNVTFIGRRGTNGNAVRNWVKDAYDGTSATRDVTVTLRTPGGSTQLSLILHDCRPVSWRLVNRNRDNTPFSSSPGLSAVEVRPEYIEFISHTNKPQVEDWYEDMRLSSQPTGKLRDITLSYLTPGGQLRERLRYEDCFLTSYVLGPLNADQIGVPCKEILKVVVGYSDDLLDP